MTISSYASLHHVTGRFWQVAVASEKLHDMDFLESIFMSSIERAGSSVISITKHAYTPQGITLMAILADSHAVFHTWPENRFVHVEIFTCGRRSTPARGVRFLQERLAPSKSKITDEITTI